MDIVLELLNNSANYSLIHVINVTIPLDYYITLLDHTFSQKWIFVGRKTYRNGKLHSFNGNPAKISANNDKFWYKNGLCHRDNDMPSIIKADGYEQWSINGITHRDHGMPALIDAKTGIKMWWINGQLQKYIM